MPAVEQNTSNTATMMTVIIVFITLATGVFDICTISYTGIRSIKVKTLQANFTEEDILIISC
jgi:hypothetical protein